MGSFNSFKKLRFGKVDSPLAQNFDEVEWGKEIYLTELFSVKRGKRLTVENRIKGNRPLVTAGYENTGVSEFISNPEQEIFPKDTITIDMFANTFYRNYEYSADDNILVLFDKQEIPSKAKMFIVNSINKVLFKKFSYGTQYRMGSFKNTKISLPIKNGKIDFEFMENFISQIESERIEKLKKYLIEMTKTSSDWEKIKFFPNQIPELNLTPKEKQILEDFENDRVEWQEFNLEKLFGKSTRGKRLKSSDRIDGNLAFVTAGENNEGISAFIGNDVEIFSENTTTIDMFGSAKYRNYKYGADDHVSIVDTENLPKLASIFVTSAIHKSSHTGEFHYGRNFYPKDANNLNILLPTLNNQPDYDKMETLISAIQKTVIKDLVFYANQKS